MIEEWRIIDGFPQYAVSNTGNFKRLYYIQKARNGKIITINVNRLLTWSGRFIHLVKDSKEYSFPRAAIILRTFVGPAPPGKPWALHKDDNQKNNVISNLYWGDIIDNTKDALKNGGFEKVRQAQIGRKRSEESKRKQKSYWENLTEEERKIYSEKRRNTWLNLPQAYREQAAKKTREQFKGKKVSEEARKNMSEAQKLLWRKKKGKINKHLKRASDTT